MADVADSAGHRPPDGPSRRSDAEADRAVRAKEAMDLIGSQALRSNLQRTVELERAWRSAAAGKLTGRQREAAIDVAHQLVGSAGTFGFQRVSQLARQLEGFFLDNDTGPRPVALAGQWLELVADELLAGPDVDDSASDD